MAFLADVGNGDGGIRKDGAAKVNMLSMCLLALAGLVTPQLAVSLKEQLNAQFLHEHSPFINSKKLVVVQGHGVLGNITNLFGGV